MLRGPLARHVAVAAAAATVALLLSGAVNAKGVGAPRAAGPPNGAVFPELPAFSWSAVRGAKSYEFQIAADRGFSSSLPGLRRTRFDTINTRATLNKAVPNGTYWWRVRALTENGQVSPWSAPRAVRKAWTAAPQLRGPVGGAKVSFPSQPLMLSWSPVPRAARYLVALATDEDLASVVFPRGKPIETSGTTFAPPITPAGGRGRTYYWAVTPLDAQGNRGTQSRITSFVWEWPSATEARLTDLRDEPETFDPQFSWRPVSGAARYEVEVNSTQDYAPGSRVCCDRAVIGSSLSPTKPLPDNTYYWRVRAIDADGNVGVWTPADALSSRFEKVFDKAAALGRPSIQNLHMRDNVSDPAPAGATQTPIAVWDAVPGASSYFVEVTPHSGSFCDWSAATQDHWRVTTAVPAWTPLGSRLQAPAPYPDKRRVSTDGSTKLVAGKSYCVRVRAKSERDSKGADVYGDFTYLNGPDQAAFTFSGYPCPQTCTRGYLPGGDYLTPQGARTTTPYFTWRGSVGGSWFVLVAKDPEFHTIVDYGWTQVPAYAPREGSNPMTYSDESTSYYWAVLPASGHTGLGAVGDPLSASPGRFEKQSTQPQLLSPESRADGPPEFRWTAVEGARRYRLQVSREDDFGKLIDDVTTASISYTADASYPADVALYWRVRAEDEAGIGLTWSPRKVFRYQLPVPDTAGGERFGATIPTWRWKPVSGAVAYDIHVALPNGTEKEFTRIRSSAWTAIKMTGTGVFRWRVRATFPKGSSGTVPGPWSKAVPFTRTIGRPLGTKTIGGGRSVHLAWSPKAGAKEYLVEVSERPDFARIVDRETTDATTYAPELRARDGKRALYWRVAAVDADRNRGAWSKPKRFRAG